MKRRFYFAAGVVGVAVLAASMYFSPVVAAVQGSISTTPIFVTQQTQFGMFAVNENTGAISFCANNSTVPAGGGQIPLGTCSAASLGSVTPTVGSNNSLSIQGSEAIAPNGGSGALIYNNQTGQSVLCAGSGVVSGGVANVVASCKTVVNLH